MRVAPLLDNGLNFIVGARVMRDNAAPGTDGSAKSGSEFGTFAELTLRSADLRVRRPAQHLAGDDAIRFKRRVAGLLISMVRNQLPSFAG